MIASEIMLPPHAPEIYLDRATLWNAVENCEKHPKAQLAYSFDIAMQNELTLEENMELARKFVQEQFVTKGMIADLAFHSPEKEDGGIPNPHFHVDHQLIRRSLEKPVYKEKLRLRSYGPAKETSPIYVELKKKYEGIVYKRRERMILSEAVPYLAGKSEPGFDSQILHEITWFRNYYRGLAPAMYIAYDRIACFGMEDRNFRVTDRKSVV